MTNIAPRQIYQLNKDLQQELEKCALEAFDRECGKVPGMREFHYDASWCPMAYYRRHLLETVLRIRLNNEVDSYCLYKISKSNNKLSKTLAQYLAEEFSHDDLFLADLASFGLDRQAVDASEPFLSTKALVGYMYREIEERGGMPTMIWNWIVEWYSDRYNGFLRNKAEAVFGKKHVRGVTHHINTDNLEDHDGLMFTAVEECIKEAGDVERAKAYVSVFMELIGWYFKELYETTADENASR